MWCVPTMLQPDNDQNNWEHSITPHKKHQRNTNQLWSLGAVHNIAQRPLVHWANHSPQQEKSAYESLQLQATKVKSPIPRKCLQETRCLHLTFWVFNINREANILIPIYPTRVTRKKIWASNCITISVAIDSLISGLDKRLRRWNYPLNMKSRERGKVNKFFKFFHYSFIKTLTV